MSFINEAALKQYIDTLYKDGMGDNEMISNAKTIKTREGVIKNLSSIRDHLIQIENYISERLNKLEKKHHEDVKEIIDIVRPRLQSAPALIGPRILQDRTAVSSQTTDGPSSNIKSINITDNMSLDALLITSLTDARLYPGTLMYIEKWRHFVVNVSGLIAHGNVGCIFVKGPSSERGTTKYPHVRDCWNTDGCPNGDKCTYYHDPEIFGDSSPSQHVRNYTNFSWMYDPNVLGPRDNHIYRKVGSLTNLTEDIDNITKSDMVKMSNQLVHDFVVFALVKKYGREGNVYSRCGGRGPQPP